MSDDEKPTEQQIAQHAASHHIAEALLKLAQHAATKTDGNVDGTVMLYALEMAASVARRWLRDAGNGRDELKSLQRSASVCGRELYDVLKRAAEEAERDPQQPPAIVQAIARALQAQGARVAIFGMHAGDEDEDPDPGDLPN